MNIAHILLGILGLALLMVVHESGHYFAARAFHMRVTKFSLGLGPTIFKHTPKGSPTTFQVALIPMLAYVQIAGMNPLEEGDPNDKGSYANASLLGRVVTIFAGPLANYLFASVLFFGSFAVGGQEIVTTKVHHVVENSPAASALMKDGDTVVEVAGEHVTEWEQVRNRVAAHPGQAIDIAVDRDGQRLHLRVTPGTTADGVRIGIEAQRELVPLTLKQSTILAVKEPAQVVYVTIVGIGRMILGKDKPDLSGPVGIVRETAKAVKNGLAFYLGWLGALSAYLGAFNMLPIPALDGGRLMFLGYEATTRRRPNPRIEAQVHAVGLLMMLALITVVTIVNDIPGRH